MSKKEFSEKDFIIRNYRTSDYQATLKILKELHEIYDIGLKEEQWRESSGLRLFKPNLKRITLVAELKSTGEVIGIGIIEAQKNILGQYIGYLNNWACMKEFIGKNVGKVLANRAFQILMSWGCQSIRINLGYEAPEKLIRLFGEVGFKPVLIVLEKRLDTQKNSL